MRGLGITFIAAAIVLAVYWPQAGAAQGGSDQPAPDLGSLLAVQQDTSVPPGAMYELKLRLFKRGKLVMESEIAIYDGLWAAVENSREQPSGQREFGSLVMVGPVGDRVSPNAQRMPEMYLEHTQRFSLGDLAFIVYCPRADTFEAEVSQAQLLAWQPPAEGAAPNNIDHLTFGPMEYRGRLSVALDTPEAGLFLPQPVSELSDQH